MRKCYIYMYMYICCTHVYMSTHHTHPGRDLHLGGVAEVIDASDGLVSKARTHKRPDSQVAVADSQVAGETRYKRLDKALSAARRRASGSLMVTSYACLKFCNFFFILGSWSLITFPWSHVAASGYVAASGCVSANVAANRCVAADGYVVASGYVADNGYVVASGYIAASLYGAAAGHVAAN